MGSAGIDTAPDAIQTELSSHALGQSSVVSVQCQERAAAAEAAVQRTLLLPCHDDLGLRHACEPDRPLCTPDLCFTRSVAVVGLAYPAYASFKALEAQSAVQRARQQAQVPHVGSCSVVCSV